MRHPLVPGWFSARERPQDLSRRDWIAQALGGMAGLPLATQFTCASEADGDPDEAKEIARVKALGRQAGLAPFSESRTKHFLGLGDADADFSKPALAICEALAEEFLSHFRDRGFKLALPPGRMTIITLKDVASYRAMLGEDPGAVVGGHYDLETNRLFVFDWRRNKADLEANPELVNLFTLVHEAIHQLCFNSGLLARNQDVPVCVSEGLATYAELWRTKGRRRMGTPNRPRLQALINSRKIAARWIPIPELLADDRVFEKDEETLQLAYAESWLLVYYLLKRDSPQFPKFRAYLAKIPDLSKEPKRVQVAEAELGPLAKLDREVFRSAQKLIRDGR